MSKYEPLDVERHAELFKALSNPNRIRLLLRLTSCCAPGTRRQVERDGGAYVGELAKDLEIGPSTVSHHVKELRRVGLIRLRRRGKHVECWIDEEVLTGLGEFFMTLGRGWAGKSR